MIKTDNVVRACDTNDTKVKSYTATKKESFELCFFSLYSKVSSPQYRCIAYFWIYNNRKTLSFSFA